jgi:thiopurine S-methyltransferase
MSIKSIRCAHPGSVGLMITFAYPQEQMQGPPFSLPDQEVLSLFSDRFEVTLLETVQLEDEKQRGLSELTSSVFKLVRI